jgi:hypothetical protein
MATLSDKEILKALYDRADDLTSNILSRKKEISSFELSLEKTKLAIAAFDGDTKIINEASIEDQVDNPTLFPTANNQDEGTSDTTWTDRVLAALTKLKSATPIEISEDIKISEPERPIEQIKKSVIRALPKLVETNQIQYEVLGGGEKRQRKKYTVI